MQRQCRHQCKALDETIICNSKQYVITRSGHCSGLSLHYSTGEGRYTACDARLGNRARMPNYHRQGTHLTPSQGRRASQAPLNHTHGGAAPSPPVVHTYFTHAARRCPSPPFFIPPILESRSHGDLRSPGGARMMQIERDKTDIRKPLISIYKGRSGAVHVGSIKE
jgi:hypothetical protein